MPHAQTHPDTPSFEAADSAPKAPLTGENGGAPTPEPAKDAPHHEVVRIDALAYGPAGIGRTAAGKAVFVEGTAPGDTVEVSIVHEKKSFAEGRIARMVQPGGCRAKKPLAPDVLATVAPWGHLSYETQLDAKRDNLINALTRIGKLDANTCQRIVDRPVPSPQQLGYRNKIELGCKRDNAGHLEVGFHRERSHDLVRIDRMPLADKAIERAPKALRGALRFVEGSNDLGLFRIGMRSSKRTRDIEVALWTEPGPFPRSLAVKVLRDALHPSSIVRVIAEAGKSRKVKRVEALYGKGCWEEKLAGCRYKVSAPSFFQVNTPQAENLVQLVLEGLDVRNGDFIADLYSGVGTFSVPLAKAGAAVVAVESSGPAVRDLRRNADLNQVTIECLGGDAARELPELGELDALVVDPPRAGLAASVPGDIAAAAPRRVAYVSCDPSTFARDIARFAEQGYMLTRAVPVDLFPQSYHAETVGFLERHTPIR